MKTEQPTPDQITLARHIIACGLPKPNHWINGTVATIHTTAQLQVDCGQLWRNPYTNEEGGILWTFVTTETGLELLPVLEDFALLGWLITELERLVDDAVEIITVDGSHRIVMVIDGVIRRCNAETRIEALTAALKSAKEA